MIGDRQVYISELNQHVGDTVGQCVVGVSSIELGLNRCKPQLTRE